MVGTKKTRLFYSIVLFGSLLAGLIIILPQFPQESLRERFTAGFTRALHQPCRIESATLQIFPHPALVLHNLSVSRDESICEAGSLVLDLSLSSLVSFTPEVVGAHLLGARIKTSLTPFGTSETGFSGQTTVAAPFPLSIDSINRNFWSHKLHLEYLLIKDSSCELSGISGLHNSLSLTDLNGSWHFSERNFSEKLELAGGISGGRGELKMTRYRVAGEKAEERDKLFDRAGDRIEISCNLKDLSLTDYELALFADGNRSLRGGLTRGTLKLDINGDPEGGLRVAAHFLSAGHTVKIYDAVSDTEKSCSQGAVKASLTGFLQRHDGYLNIKSAALEYPGAATLFYRGLVRFNKPFFVDLVSELKVNDLGLFTHSLPCLALSGYEAGGELAGQLKLVGNPGSAPVLQVQLKADKIVLQPAALSSSPEAKSSIHESEKASDKESAAGFKPRFGAWLRQVASWGWRIKSDCKIAALELPEMTVSDISLLAEKSLVQVEIERLAAHFGKAGQLRLSLILENLLDDPRWQASLVAEKLDLKPFAQTVPWTGILNASLVGGGRLQSDSGQLSDFDLNGKWNLRRGRLHGCSLMREFSNFLERSGKKRVGENFSLLAGKFTLRNNVLSLKKLKLVTVGNRLTADGKFFFDAKRLKFYGRYLPKTSSPLSFNLSGSCQKPQFKVLGR